MGLLKGLFGGGGGKGAEHAEDSVWTSDAARLAGVRGEIERSRARGGVLVVARSASELGALASEYAAFEPARCADVFARESVSMRLGQAGSVTLALASALPAQAAAARIPISILGWGRSDTRSPDDAVVRFADFLGPKATITFHVSLDDPLLQKHSTSLKPMLEALGATGEAITSPMVSRAIRSVQEKNEKR